MANDLQSAVESLSRRKKDMGRYAEIIDRVQETDVSVDIEFQRIFTGFYRVRRNEDSRRTFYDLFERCKGMETVTFEYVLKELYARTGRIEASFSSKMVATLNTDMPIWDSIVLGKLHMKPRAYKDKEQRLQEAVEIYHSIELWYQELLHSPNAPEILDAFDEAFPEYSRFSAVKKVDFLLWGSGSTDPLQQSIFMIDDGKGSQFVIT